MAAPAARPLWQVGVVVGAVFGAGVAAGVLADTPDDRDHPWDPKCITVEEDRNETHDWGALECEDGFGPVAFECTGRDEDRRCDYRRAGASS